MKKSENFDLIEPIVTFGLAKLAKEKEFPQIRMGDINSHYNEFGNLNGTILHAKDYIREKKLKGKDCFMLSYVAPTQGMLQRWLRNMYGIHITITRVYECSSSPAIFDGWNIHIGDEYFESSFEINNFLISKYFNTYEEALEEGLICGLNLIKSKNE